MRNKRKNIQNDLSQIRTKSGLLFLSLICMIILMANCNFKNDDIGYGNIDDALLREMEIDNIPSLSVCIVKNNDIVWRKAYGSANLDTNQAARTDNIYMVASVSKLVIVTAVLQLKELGMLDLDTDINNYLPFEIRHPDYSDIPITVRMLLTHTSGLSRPEHNEVQNYNIFCEPGECPSLEDGLRDLLLPDGDRYSWRIWNNYAPGTKESYSNVATGLAAYIVEVLSGEDYNDYCIKNIFKPLEMNDTSYSWTDLDMNKAVISYHKDLTPIPFYGDQMYPGGSLKTSVEDFSNFIIMYMNNGVFKGKRILNSETVEEILTIHNPATGKCLIWDVSIGNWYSHSGNIDGAGAHVDFQRDSKIGFLIFGNRTTTPVYPGNPIYDIVRNEAVKYR